MLFHVARGNDRKITFKQFEAALKLLAEKKYGSPDVDKLQGVILQSSGPKTSGATVSSVTIGVSVDIQGPCFLAFYICGLGIL